MLFLVHTLGLFFPTLKLCPDTQLSKCFIYLFIYFWHYWIFLAVGGLSLVVTSRDYSCCGAWTSHCGGFSCWRAWTVGCTGFHCSTWAHSCDFWVSEHCSIAVEHGLSCSAACGISLDQGLNSVPALAGGFLTTRLPGKFLFIFHMFYDLTGNHCSGQPLNRIKQFCGKI